jgi:hypothetical protein
MTLECREWIERQCELEEPILNALAGLSEQEAIRAIVAAIAAHFAGPSLAKIIADLTALQQFAASADTPYGNA